MQSERPTPCTGRTRLAEAEGALLAGESKEQGGYCPFCTRGLDDWATDGGYVPISTTLKAIKLFEQE